MSVMCLKIVHYSQTYSPHLHNLDLFYFSSAYQKHCQALLYIFCIFFSQELSHALSPYIFSHDLTLALVSWFLHTLNAFEMGHSKSFEIENTCGWSTCNDEDILLLNLSWAPNHFCISAVRAELMSNHLILPIQFFYWDLTCDNLHHWNNTSQMLGLIISISFIM